MSGHSKDFDQARVRGAKQAWVRPALTRMAAGSAENSPNANRFDGGLSSGS